MLVFAVEENLSPESRQKRIPEQSAAVTTYIDHTRPYGIKRIRERSEASRRWMNGWK